MKKDAELEADGQGSVIPGSSDDELSPPHRKKGRHQSPLSLETLQQLLDQQTRELREAQKLELAKATAQIKAEQKTVLAGVNQQLQHHTEELASIKHNQSDMEKRLTRLEQGGMSTAAGSSGHDEARNTALVFGGWGQGVRSSTVIEELETALRELHIHGKLDARPYTPGVRKGIALSQLTMRDAESPADLHARMMDVIKAISEAEKHLPHMAPDRKLWASVSRPKGERDRAAHASKIRRVLHSLGNGLISQADTEYLTGTLFLGDRMAGSAIKPRPPDAGRVLAEGRLPGAWVDIGHIAKFAKVPESVVHKAWQDALAPPSSPPSTSGFTPTSTRAAMSWNLAGSHLDKFWNVVLPRFLEEDPHFFALQELPRADEGWARVTTRGNLRLLAFRHPEAWRGLGIAFRHDLYALCSKSASHHAIWAVFQHRASSKRITIGVCHLESGIPNDDFELQLTEVLHHPKTKGLRFSSATSTRTLVGASLMMGRQCLWPEAASHKPCRTCAWRRACASSRKPTRRSLPL